MIKVIPQPHGTDGVQLSVTVSIDDPGGRGYQLAIGGVDLDGLAVHRRTLGARLRNRGDVRASQPGAVSKPSDCYVTPGG